MKHSLFLSLVLLSLTFTSCSLIQKDHHLCSMDSDCKETEKCHFPSEGIMGSCVINIATPITEPPILESGNDSIEPKEIPTDTTVVSGTKPTKTPDKNTVTPPTKENSEVSTEDLTKELDSFVDDITKGF